MFPLSPNPRVAERIFGGVLGHPSLDGSAIRGTLKRALDSDSHASLAFAQASAVTFVTVTPASNSRPCYDSDFHASFMSAQAPFVTFVTFPPSPTFISATAPTVCSVTTRVGALQMSLLSPLLTAWSDYQTPQPAADQAILSPRRCV